MALTDAQAKTIKEQLLKQAEKFPEDKKEEVIKYIKSMNNEQLEEFLKKNQAMAKEEQAKEGPNKPSSKSSGTDCVYCLIAEKQIESSAIYEDKDYLAVLEINPLSEGHIVLIPKKHIAETKNLKAKAFTIADKIGKHLVKQLKAENFQISSSDELKHAVINIIPTYKGKKLERKQADKKQIQELAIKIGELKKRAKKSPVKKETNLAKEQNKLVKDIIKLPRRIP
ncbi:MAG: HIT family protein [Nanoarchaeota archaeon]